MLTVVSWCDGKINAARWDIDNIDDWQMDILEGAEAKKLLLEPNKTKSGTEIIWTRSDRVFDKNNISSLDDLLTSSIGHSNQRLSLVFHRYLAGEAGRKFTITVNGRPLSGIDPFMSHHHATQTLDAEFIKTADGSNITIQPYVLPHFSKLTIEEQERLGGPEGMVRNQDFTFIETRDLSSLELGSV